MKVFVSSCVYLICVCLFASSALAVDDSDLRVALVDMQRALSESKAGVKAQKAYEKQVRSAQADLDSKKEDFEKEKGKFEKQRDSLSDKARLEKEEKLIGLEKNLKRSFQDTQEKLRRENAKIVSELVGELRKVVSEVGKDDGFTMILESSSQSVLYADNSIDITDKVIGKFDLQN